MNLQCMSCGQTIDYSSRRPSFCGFCGKPLSPVPTPVATGPDVTAEFQTPATPEATVDSPSSRPSPHQPIPEKLGNYRILRRIGSGGMGDVFEARDESTGRHVAVKTIRSGASASSSEIDRFRREGRVASQLAHPHVVFVFATDEANGLPYIVMELMPGKTLKDMVDENGPLTIKDAIMHTLDILDGLIEAHRLGVVHRDVKPSNCFLDHAGRVKVGDFGLSKSLSSIDHLTQSGVFMGTPLFASLEQVRGDKVDEQSDLYSVAATLYFLLRGRAPYQNSDSASTLARIATDPIPSIRDFRPEIPAALDVALKRGLERDRSKRWKSLREFRSKLASFLPQNHVAPPLIARFGALCCDYAITSVMFIVLGGVLGVLLRFQGTDVAMGLGGASVLIGTVVLQIAYFAAFEWWMQATPGKWLFGLRVACANGPDVPSGLQTLIRNLVFRLGYLLSDISPLYLSPMITSRPADEAIIGRLFVVLFLTYGGLALGIGLALFTMRKRNGYRGLYEFASGTRVVRLSSAVETTTFEADLSPVEPIEAAEPGQAIGPFQLRGILRRTDDEEVLLAEEPNLSRQITVLRRADGIAADDYRRDLVRPARQRWLTNGIREGTAWEAYFLPAGQTIRRLVASRGALDWTAFRPVFYALAQEADAAQRDGTLPASLSVDQVWIQANGKPVLLEAPMPGANGSAPLRTGKDRAMALLEDVARLALSKSRPGSAGSRIPGPIPLHARAIVDDLVERHEFDEFGAEDIVRRLEKTKEKQTVITRGKRMGALFATAVVLLPLLASCLGGVVWTKAMQGLAVPSIEVREREIHLELFQSGAIRELEISALNPAPGAQLIALAQYSDDLRTTDRLSQVLTKQKKRLEIRRQYASAVSRGVTEVMEVAMGPPALQSMQRSSMSALRALAGRRLRNPENEIAANVMRTIGVFQVGILVLFLIVTSWIFRGSFVKTLLGIRLVNRRGERAGRFRCAWRTFCLWGPATLLIALGILLESDAWRQVDAGTINVWQFRLASIATISGYLMLVGHAVLALAFPTRSLLDWVSGVHLVPD